MRMTLLTGRRFDVPMPEGARVRLGTCYASARASYTSCKPLSWTYRVGGAVTACWRPPRLAGNFGPPEPDQRQSWRASHLGGR